MIPNPTPSFLALNHSLGWGDPATAGLMFVGVEPGGGFDIELDAHDINGQHQAIIAQKTAVRCQGPAGTIWPYWVEPFYGPSGSSRSRISVQADMGCSVSSSGLTPREYEAKKLWQALSSVWNVNLFPLSKPSQGGGFSDAYMQSFGFVDAYEYTRYVRDTRWKALKLLHTAVRPSATICYAKGRWNQHREVFQLPERPTGTLNKGRLELYDLPTGRFILIPHFSHNRLTSTDIVEIIAQLKKWQVTLP